MTGTVPPGVTLLRHTNTMVTVARIPYIFVNLTFLMEVVAGCHSFTNVKNN